MTEFRYDPFVASFQHTMYDDYRTMRDDHPVYVDPRGDFVALSRFEDVWNAVHDHDRFSSDAAEARGLLPMMIYFDPPRHTANRAIVSRAFTPKRIAGIESIVTAVAERLCDELAMEKEFDFEDTTDSEYAAFDAGVKYELTKMNLALEAAGVQALSDQGLTTGIGRRDGSAGHQRLGKFECGTHGAGFKWVSLTDRRL